MKSLQMPFRYLQGQGLIDKLIKYTCFYGDNYAFITDETIENMMGKRIEKIFKSEKNKKYSIFKYEKDCNQREIDNLLSRIDKDTFDIIVGVGGGKSLDIAKIIAATMDKTLVIIPTTASNDSATSALSVLYKEDGTMEKYIYHNKNPHLVLIDSDIIIKAPVRHLIAGMGETLSTYYEAKACYDSKILNILGGTPSMSAINVSKLALEIVLEKGLLAKISAEQGIVNEAVDQVIEANIFMSGFGFENSGLAAAHSIHNGLVELPETAPYLHGEKVAFGTIVQLVLENKQIDEILKIINFCKKVGLPHKLADLGINTKIEEKAQIIAQRACIKGESIHHLPFEIRKNMVYDSIMVANKLGSYE